MNYSPGIYENLPYEEYAAIPAYRSHDLTSVIKCPYTWKYQKDLEPSPALLEGRVQHTVFLEHHKFAEEFVIQPNIDRRTKAGKAEYEDFSASIGNRTAITQDLYDTCMERRSVVTDYIPKETDKVECTLIFEWFGQPFKCRMDWYDNQYIWDLKTCRDASPRGFRTAINTFRYYQQAAYYLSGARLCGLKAEKFYFLAVEKQSPYPYGVYTLSDEAIAFGDARNEQAIAIAQQCFDSGEWMPFNNAGVTEFSVDELW